jgi:ribonucleoside-diphosphate reductase alpha chain
MRGVSMPANEKSTSAVKMGFHQPSNWTEKTRAGDALEGATALKTETETNLSPAEKLEALQWSNSGAAREASVTKAERRAEAKAKGYEGEMCSECGNFTLVRNGTCMKCDTCGSTTGCS